MSTFVTQDATAYMLDSIITSKTRLKLLIKFFVSASNKGYLRGLAEEFNESTNSIRRELNQLTDAGYLLREESDQKIFYRSNTKHSLFQNFQGLIRDFLGWDKIVDQVFDRAGDVEELSLLGDYAEGVDSGHIEVLVKGDVDMAYLLQASVKAEDLLHKKVTIYTDQPDHSRHKIVLYKKANN